MATWGQGVFWAILAFYVLGGTVYCVRMMHNDDGRERFDLGLFLFFPVYLCVVFPLVGLASLGKRLIDYIDGHKSN